MMFAVDFAEISFGEFISIFSIVVSISKEMFSSAKLNNSMVSVFSSFAARLTEIFSLSVFKYSSGVVFCSSPM